MDWRHSLMCTLALKARCLLQVSGTWYLKATAWDKEIPHKMFGSVSVTPMNIKTLEGGNMQVTFTVL